MTDSLLDALAKPPSPPSELDELMSRDPLELSAQDIDKIIQFQRQARARREAGPTKRGAKSDLKDGSGIDLTALVLNRPTLEVKKVVVTNPGTGFRRI